MMFFFLLVILSVSFTEQIVYQCDSKADCGCSLYPVSMNARIINGEAAGKDTLSWAVSLEISGSLCGGAIISPSYILTAAHCVDGASASSINAYVGSTGLKGGTRRSISRIYQHPDYFEDPRGQYLLNDIALLKLATQLDLSDSSLAKICLPKEKISMNSSMNLIAIGWGTKYDGSSYASDDLEQVTIKYVDFNTQYCSRVAINSSIQFCAGIMPMGGKDTCQGDSGGPLMRFNNDKLWEVQGVVSYGKGCARPNYPGVYTRVDFYSIWISNILNTDPAPSNSPMLFSFSSGCLFFFMIFIHFFHSQ